MRPPYLIALVGLLLAGCDFIPPKSMEEVVAENQSLRGCTKWCAPYKTTGFTTFASFQCICSWEPASPPESVIVIGPMEACAKKCAGSDLFTWNNMGLCECGLLQSDKQQK